MTFDEFFNEMSDLEAKTYVGKLRATNKALRDVLEEIFDYEGGAENALEDEYVIERARTALAASTEETQDG